MTQRLPIMLLSDITTHVSPPVRLCLPFWVVVTHHCIWKAPCWEGLSPSSELSECRQTLAVTAPPGPVSSLINPNP